MATIDFKHVPANLPGRRDYVEIAWSDVEDLLGREHEGTTADDKALTDALVASGAPAWVTTAEGYISEAGWGLYGPELAD